MKRNLIPVEGHENLARDPATNIILNINKDKSEQYKRLRDQKLKEQQKIESLESDVQEIKAMLQKLLENGTNG